MKEIIKDIIPLNDNNPFWLILYLFYFKYLNLINLRLIFINYYNTINHIYITELIISN